MNPDIKKILNRHKLKSSKVIRMPDNGVIRSNVILVKDSKEAKYILKVFDSKDLEAKKRFLAEIDNAILLKKSLSKKYKLWIPTIYWYSKHSEKPYLIYKYFEGLPLGQFIEDMGIQFGRFRHSNFDDFMGFFDEIESLDLDLDLGDWGYRTAMRELKHYFENAKNILPSEMYDRVLMFVESHHKDAFAEKIPSHRDLYPENIMIKSSQSKAFCFLDWEYLSRVPIGFNAAFLYLLFWREEYWKAKVLSHYYNKYKYYKDGKYLRKFYISFRLCLVVLGVRFLYQINSFCEKDNPNFKHAMLSWLHDIDSTIQARTLKPKNIKFYLMLSDVYEVAKLYGVNDVSGFEVFYASKGNCVAKVKTANQNYIFRFYSQSRSKSFIKKELQIFDKLASTDVKTYKIYKSLNGELFVEYKLYGMKRRIAVFSFIDGSKISRQWAGEKVVRNLGSMLRNIHDQAVIHGDFSKENVLFLKDKITGVIDFEWGRITNSRRAKFNDLAKAIALWLIDIRYKKISDKTFIEEFVKGYYRGGFVKKPHRLAEVVINKILAEREVYIGTSDLGDNALKLGKRFDHAIDAVKEALL